MKFTKKKFIWFNIIIIVIPLIALIILKSILWYRDNSYKFIYDDEWIIGKTVEEINEKYGKFDIKQTELAEGISFSGGYITKEKTYNAIDPEPEQYYKIYFNEDGIAISVKEKWVIPGG